MTSVFSAQSAPRILTSEAPAPQADAPMPWRGETFGPGETLLLSCFIVYLGLFLLVALVFGYAGVIVMAITSAATMLAALVIATATGLG